MVLAFENARWFAFSTGGSKHHEAAFQRGMVAKLTLQTTVKPTCLLSVVPISFEPARSGLPSDSRNGIV